MLLLSQEYLLILLKQEFLSALDFDHALRSGSGRNRAERGGCCELWQRNTLEIGLVYHAEGGDLKIILGKSRNVRGIFNMVKKMVAERIFLRNDLASSVASETSIRVFINRYLKLAFLGSSGTLLLITDVGSRYIFQCQWNLEFQ